LSAFIFDVDGTLAETEELHREAFNAAFAGAGLDWTWARPRYEALLAVSGGKERLRHFLRLEGIELSDTERRIAELHAEKTAIYADLVGRGRLVLRPGVDDLIRAAEAAGIRLAVATTTTLSNVEALLEAAGIDPRRFEAMVCGDAVARKKPAPDVYLAVLQALGVPAAACLAFEDSWNGLAAAKAAGLRCVVTPALYTEREDFSAADLVLPDLRDAGRLIALVTSGPERLSQGTSGAAGR
jgi:HAD superfamily hydrolase (TIGR01509 family)